MKKVIILGIILIFGFLNSHAMEEGSFLDIGQQKDEFKSKIPQNTIKDGDLELVKQGSFFYIVENLESVKEEEKRERNYCSCLKDRDDSKYCG